MNLTAHKLLMAAWFLAISPLIAAEEEIPDLTELREQADSALNQDNVSARGDIDVVFTLVDRLLEEDQELATRYLQEGLKHFPWNLKYQIIYAELLTKRGELDQAREKARFVLTYGETDELIERGRELLGKKRIPEFSPIKPIPGKNHAIVLIPLLDPDKWLLSELKEQLSAKLGVPVHIQSVEMTNPPFSRDLRQAILESVRKNVTDSIENPVIAESMSVLGVNQQDLLDESKLLELLRALMQYEGPGVFGEFESLLQESRGKDPQWDAFHLLDALTVAVKPYRRKRVAYLGITARDIYAKDFNFLFGWAGPRGGVMSYRRFTASFNQEPPNQSKLLKRTLMQSLSSIGLIRGLERCSSPVCARAYPNNLAEHDAKSGDLCKQCENGFKKIFEHMGPRRSR